MPFLLVPNFLGFNSELDLKILRGLIQLLNAILSRAFSINNKPTQQTHIVSRNKYT